MSKTLGKSLGTDMVALAEMIRSKGRGRDTVLAHITPKEAALLKRRGGSGTTNPDTGLPEFEDEDFMGGFGNIDTGEIYTPEQVAEQYPEYYPGGELPQEGEATIFYPNEQPEYIPEAGNYDYYTPAQPAPPQYTEQQFRQAAAGQLPAGTGNYQAPEKSFLDKSGDALSKLLTPETLARLGILGGIGAFGAKKGQQSAQQGAAAAAEVKALAPPVLARSEIAQTQLRDLGANILAQTRINAAELSALGAPQRELGKQLMSQALSGTLTPAGQRSLAALKAQARQNISKRGGVGAMQAGVAESEATANLLQQQYSTGMGTYGQGAQYESAAIGMNQQALQAANGMQVAAINTGLQQAGIADQYTMAAINLALANDKTTAQSLQNLFGQLASVGFGVRPTAPVTT
jgi:hypothetical protein